MCSGLGRGRFLAQALSDDLLLRSLSLADSRSMTVAKSNVDQEQAEGSSWSEASILGTLFEAVLSLNFRRNGSLILATLCSHLRFAQLGTCLAWACRENTY